MCVCVGVCVCVCVCLFEGVGGLIYLKTKSAERVSAKLFPSLLPFVNFSFDVISHYIVFARFFLMLPYR